MLDAEDLVKIAAYALSQRGERMKSMEIVDFMLTQQGRSALSQMGIDIMPDTDPYSFASRLSKVLSRHVKDNRENSRAVDGTSAGWVKGQKAIKFLGLAHVDYLRTESKAHVGAAGEYAVMSELLAADWNATKFPVDDGVDIIAVKGQEMRTVQVKASHASASSQDKFSFSLDGRAHEKYRGIRHYYVFVLRRHTGLRWLNDFLVLSSTDVDRYRNHGEIAVSAEKWWVTIEIRDSRYFLGTNSEVTERMNQVRQYFQ